MKLLTLRVGKLQTNCYLVTSDARALVLDPGGDAPDILTALGEAQARLEQIILTHGHADHVAAAMELHRATGAEICIHPADAPYLSAVTDHMATYLGLKEEIKPHRFFSEGELVRLAGIVFQVLSTPGHTPGSCCLYSHDKAVLFSGDTLFALSIGRSDLPGGDPKLLAASLGRLKHLPDGTEVYPGHGPATTIGRERVRNRYW